MAKPLLIDYALLESGWAQCSILYENQTVDVAASYLNDSLGELAFAAHHLACGGEISAVVFMNEPGEHHLVFTRISDLECRFTLTWFDDDVSHARRPLPSSKLLMSGTVLIRSLANQVYNLLVRLLEQYGTTGYKSRWMKHDFPLGDFSMLREAITAPST